MSSAGGGYQGPLLSRAEWRERIERGFPGIRYAGGQGRLERGAGFIEVELASGDPVSEVNVRWSGPGPGVTARRFIAEHGLQEMAPSLPPVPIAPPRGPEPRGRTTAPTRRRQTVTACLAAAGGACLLLSTLLLARPHLDARLMAHNESQVVKRLHEMNPQDPASALPVYAGYLFERPPGSAKKAIHARPLLPGLTGGGWFILMEGRVYRDPEFDRLAELQAALEAGGGSEP